MNQEDIISLFAFLLTSARNLADEPKKYAQSRFVDVMDRFYKFLADNMGYSDNRIKEIIDDLNAGKDLNLTDEEAFLAVLDRNILRLTDIIADI